MPANQGADKFIDLTDFTPGIQSTLGSDLTVGQDGAATPDNTWGCVAYPGGGIGPGPRLDLSHQPAWDMGVLDDVADWPDGYQQASVAAVGILAPIGRANIFDATPAEWRQNLAHPDEVFVLYSFLVPDGDDFRNAWIVRKYHFFNDPVDSTDLVPDLFAHGIRQISDGPDLIGLNVQASPIIAPGPWPGICYPTGWLDASTQRYGPSAGDDEASTEHIANMDTRPAMSFALADAVGANADDASAHDLGTAPYGYAVNVLYQYPQPDTNYSSLHGAAGRLMGGDTDAWRQKACGLITGMFCHQGRSVVLGAKPVWFGNMDYETSQVIVPERVTFTPPLGHWGDGGYGEGVWVEENPSGIGAWGSVNANELLIVKNAGGGAVITGPLSAPTVIRNPSIPSVGWVPNRAVVTTQGLAYGTRSGVWLWNGGDTAQCLSDRLGTGWFWKPGPTEVAPDLDMESALAPAALRGTFGFSYPYLFAPNNWILDMRTAGWFRLSATPEFAGEDGHALPYAHYATSVTGHVYAMPQYLSPDQTTVCDRWDPNDETDAWSWQSQPLVRTRARLLEFREVAVVVDVQQPGHLRITLSSIDQTTKSVDFEITKVGRYIIRQPIHFHGQDVQVRMEADVSSGEAAFRVLRLSLAYREGKSIAAASS